MVKKDKTSAGSLRFAPNFASMLAGDNQNLDPEFPVTAPTEKTPPNPLIPAHTSLEPSPVTKKILTHIPIHHDSLPAQ
jgi:hypothetical protein